MKSRAPQLHLEYRFYKALGSGGECIHKFWTIASWWSIPLRFDKIILRKWNKTTLYLSHIVIRVRQYSCRSEFVEIHLCFLRRKLFVKNGRADDCRLSSLIFTLSIDKKSFKLFAIHFHFVPLVVISTALFLVFYLRTSDCLRFFFSMWFRLYLRVKYLLKVILLI